MRAVDTNIIVRFLTADDADQSPRARAAIAAGDILVPVTVVQEAAWVLTLVYRHPRAAVVAGLKQLLGLPGVTVEDAPAVARALDWTAQGLDIADALHLARSRDCATLLTFDARFVARAAGLGEVTVVGAC